MRFMQLYVVLMLFVFSANLGAQEIWLKKDLNNSNEREFITIEKLPNDSYDISSFKQIRGEYQKVNFQKNLSENDYQRFIINFEKVEKLEHWKIEQEDNFSPSTSIWEVKEQWSEQWEIRYAEWLRREVDSEFFFRHRIAIDCADATIGFRWIFARNHHLPMANTQAGSGNLFGHFSMKREWNSLPRAKEWYNDRVFLAALDYVMSTTSTWSLLFYDGIPVRLDTQGLRAGTIIVSYQNNSGHLRTIVENYFNRPNELPVYTYSATSPREVRTLYREPFIDQMWPIYRERSILALRWPVLDRSGKWILAPAENDSRYSWEQFNPDLSTRYSLIQYIIEKTNPNFNPQNLIQTSIRDIKGYLEIRKKIVSDGFYYCQQNGCPENSKAYDDWSTPSRDRQVLLKYVEMQTLLRNFEPMSPGLVQKWQDQLDNEVIIVEGRYLSLSYVRILFERNMTSSNPNVSILRRWGLE